jgi:hypothetical protein
MVRRIRRDRTYWFCRTCWQEMPLIHVHAPETANVLQPRTLTAEVVRVLA